MKKSLLIIPFLVLFSSNSFTQTSFDFFDENIISSNPNCENFKNSYGVLSVQRLWSEDAKTCWISILPTDVPELNYRQFIFSSDGGFLVFNSFGNGPAEQYTGARKYFFFPQTQNQLQFSVNESKKQFQVILPNQKKVGFKFDQTAPQSFESAKIQISGNIEPKNRGGLEFVSYDGVYMDCGFQMGQNPTANPYRFCQFFDAKRTSCRIQNQQLFDYSDNGDVFVRSEDEIKATVLRLCPNFEWK